MEPGSPIHHVPPGSTALLELCHAIDQALALPKPATEAGELAYLRILRDRVRQVRAAMKRLIHDGRDADDQDIMCMVVSLRAHVGELADDRPGYRPGPTA